MMESHIEESSTNQEKLPETEAKRNNNRSFHDSMKYLLFTSQFFALFPLDGVLNSNYHYIHFSWWSFRVCYSLIITCVAFVEGYVCAYFLTQVNEFFDIEEMNIILYYERGTLNCLAFLKLAKNWPDLMKEFDKIENILRFYPSSKFLSEKLRIISFGLFFAASVEHFSAQIIKLVKSFKCEDSIAEGFHHFFAYMSYRQVFHFIPYNFFVGVLLQLMNLILAFGSTFIDVFIVFASVNFSEKLVQLNKQICSTVEKQVGYVTTWRALRENYTRLFNLFLNFNGKLNNIILLSFASNIFYLLTQVYLWLRSNWNEQIALHYIYFVFSISLLVSRTSFVCFYGASVQRESNNLLKTLVATPSNLYNLELKKFIVQVNTSPMILSGNKYFYITRSLIMTIAGSIVTYELVMVQFSEEITKDINNTSSCQSVEFWQS